MNRESEK
jgi:hypothetical protein